MKPEYITIISTRYRAIDMTYTYHYQVWGRDYYIRLADEELLDIHPQELIARYHRYFPELQDMEVYKQPILNTMDDFTASPFS